MKIQDLDEKKYTELKDSASSLFTDLFILLIKFFLKGVFTKIPSDKLEKDLEDLKTSLFSIETPFISLREDRDQYAKKWQKTISDYFGYISHAFEAALYFNSLCLNIQNKKYVNPNTNIEQDSIISKEDKTMDMKNALNNVIRLTYYDFEFAMNGGSEYLIKRLCEIIYLFQDGKEDFHQLTLEKTRFLLKKALLFHKREGRKEFLVFIKDESFKCEDILKESALSKKTKNLCELISIYEKDKLDNDSLSDLNALKNTFEGLNLKSIENYIEVKILKDSASMKSDIDTMIESIKRIKTIGENLPERNENSEFDTIVLKINKIFIFNNLISLSDELMEHINKGESVFFENIDKRIKEVYEIVTNVINQIENKLENNENYFTYYKYSKFLCNYYQYQLLKKSPKEVKNIHNKIEVFTHKASELFYKVHDKFQKYRLKQNESFIGDQDKKVFVYSSINLPFNNSEQQTLIDVQNVKANTIDIDVKARKLDQKTKDFDRKAKDLDQKTKEVKKDVQEVNKRSTGVFAFFSVIVLFAAGSFQSLAHLDDIHKVVIMLSLVGVFAGLLFLSFYFIIQEREPISCWRFFTILVMYILIYLGIIASSQFLPKWFEALVSSNKEEQVHKPVSSQTTIKSKKNNL